MRVRERLGAEIVPRISREGAGASAGPSVDMAMGNSEGAGYLQCVG